MQDPFRNLSNLEQQANRIAGQASNPQAQAKQKADMIKRTINQGTANIIGALCYVTGVVVLLVPTRKEWRMDQTIMYHAAHARLIWLVMIICACSVIGLPVAALLYLTQFYLASEAVAGRRPSVPLVSRFVMDRGWTATKQQ